jgi:hypothetical protein
MADQSDVEETLVQIIAQALYPDGTARPSATGGTVRVYRGWPVAAALDADLATGIVNVTIYPESVGQENTTRWLDDTQADVPQIPTLVVTVAGNVATFTGDAAAGQVAGLIADGLAVVHRTRTGDTPAMVAATLAAQLRTVRTALLQGTTVVVPLVHRLEGRVFADQSVRREVKRQRQRFRITCWSPDPASRDGVAAAIDAALAVTRFLALPDGSSGRLRFAASEVTDRSETAALFRRDLIYTVEYPTLVAANEPRMVVGDIQLSSAGADAIANRMV